MSISEKLLIVCITFYCTISSGCSVQLMPERTAHPLEATSRSSVQPKNAYEVPWRLIIVDEAPEYMIMKTTVFDPETAVSSTEWERVQYPFKGGILRSHMIKKIKRPPVTSVLDVFYDLYFIFQDGTVAEKHFSPVDIEEYYGRYIDILPRPRQRPSDQLRGLLTGESDGIVSEVDSGKQTPLFRLRSFDGETVDLSDYSGKIIVLEWLNLECPLSMYHYKLNTMVRLANKYKGKNVIWLAVNSTKHTTAQANTEFAEKYQLPYPIIDDRWGKVGRAYGAKTTPHMYIIGPRGTIVYEGAIDNSPMGRMKRGAVNYVDKALSELTKGKPVSVPATKPYGCSVKYAR